MKFEELEIKGAYLIHAEPLKMIEVFLEETFVVKNLYKTI